MQHEFLFICSALPSDHDGPTRDEQSGPGPAGTGTEFFFDRDRDQNFFSRDRDQK
jgi:hypothetical protein